MELETQVKFSDYLEVAVETNNLLKLKKYKDKEKSPKNW